MSLGSIPGFQALREFRKGALLTQCIRRGSVPGSQLATGGFQCQDTFAGATSLSSQGPEMGTAVRSSLMFSVLSTGEMKNRNLVKELGENKVEQRCQTVKHKCHIRTPYILG